MNRRLYRSRSDSVIGGVAGGVAEYLDVDPSIVRIVWAILAIVTGGIFFVLYIVMWIVVPETPTGPYRPAPDATPGWTPPGGEGAAAAPPPPPGSPAGEPAPPDTTAAGEQPAAWAPPAGGYAGEGERSRRRGSNGAMIFGLLLVGIGVWFLLDEYVPGLDSDLLWPIALVALGLGLLFVSMRRSER